MSDFRGGVRLIVNQRWGYSLVQNHTFLPYDINPMEMLPDESAVVISNTQ